MLAKEAFLQDPDHNKPFHIYADASDYQLGSVIMQKGKQAASFSRKLNTAQRNYTTGEKELLSIVETLKEYRTMLYDCRDIPSRQLAPEHGPMVSSRVRTLRHNPPSRHLTNALS
jgi:Cu2+-containing amine oxidase